MIRVVVENILLFLLPTAMYVGYMLLTRRTTPAGTIVNDAPLLWLFVTGALLVAGSATPLREAAALRAAPVLTAVSLEVISEATSVSYISEVEWGVWAQVKIGETIGWVDATSVRLEAAP